MEELAPGVVLPFVHRPLSQYVNAMADARPADRAHGRARAARASSPRRAEYRDAATIPRLLVLVARKLVTWRRLRS